MSCFRLPKNKYLAGWQNRLKIFNFAPTKIKNSMKYGFVKVAAAVPAVKVADCEFNVEHIISMIKKADEQKVDVICFPELCITGYTCQDLFFNSLLLDEAEKALDRIVGETADLEILAIVGLPLRLNGCLYNMAALVQEGRVIGYVPKTYMPNYKEFYELRWFSSADNLLNDTVFRSSLDLENDINGYVYINKVFSSSKFNFGIELCEDLWAVNPPSNELVLKGADIIFNLSGSNEVIGKHNYRMNLISSQSARCMAGYVYASCGFGESTQDLVFAGNAYICENGSFIAQSCRFDYDEQLVLGEIDVEKIRNERMVNKTYSQTLLQRTEKDNDFVTFVERDRYSQEQEMELTRRVNPHPFVPTGKALDERCEEIFNIQVAGLAKRIVHTNAQTVVLGISGGLDSTLALLVCVKTFDKLKRDRKGIVGVTMPGFGTTGRTYNNSIKLMESLGITMREISIKDACIQHFKDINHSLDDYSVTYENGQARERTQVLMDVANQMNGFVVGTGDLSELALGWATYNADHMSNYGVNCSIPKTLVKHLVAWVANSDVVNELARTTLLDIVDTPISPELIPADENGNIKQKTEDLVGPYELHDFFLYNMLRFGFRPSKIYYLAKNAFQKQNEEGRKAAENGDTSYNTKYVSAGIVGYYDDETIKKWLKTFCRRFFTQQFKRSCLPDGPKVGSVTLSPRGDWRMPSDASYNLWVKECENL